MITQDELLVDRIKQIHNLLHSGSTEDEATDSDGGWIDPCVRTPTYSNLVLVAYKSKGDELNGDIIVTVGSYYALMWHDYLRQKFMLCGTELSRKIPHPTPIFEEILGWKSLPKYK